MVTGDGDLVRKKAMAGWRESGCEWHHAWKGVVGRAWLDSDGSRAREPVRTNEVAPNTHPGVNVSVHDAGVDGSGAGVDNDT